MILWFEKRRFISLIMTLLIAVEIFYFSSIPGISLAAGGNLISRIYHFTVFFLLGFFLFITIKGNQEMKVKHILLVLLISIIYAISDEFHQMFVPFRAPDVEDILTNSAGIFSSIILHVYSHNKAANL